VNWNLISVLAIGEGGAEKGGVRENILSLSRK